MKGKVGCDENCFTHVGACRHGVLRGPWDTPEVKFFGDHGNPHMQHVEVPVGAKCVYCEEGVVAEDLGMAIASVGHLDLDLQIPGHPEFVAYHRECFYRTIFGSLDCQKSHGHIRGTCIDVPEGMTKRQAAKAAMEYGFAVRRN